MLSPKEQQEYLREVAELAGVPVPDGPIVLPTEGDVIVGPRMRLHYFDWGRPNGSAPDILFVHGGGLTARTWDLVCMMLRDQYRCLAIDLRGHGDSEWSPELDYAPRSLAGDVEGFVDAMGLDKFILVGMSLGGLTSLNYAPRRVDKLRALVIVDVGPEMVRAGDERLQRFMQEGESIGTVDELVDRAMKFNPRRSPTILRRSLLLNLRERSDGEMMWKYDRRRYQQRQQDQERQQKSEAERKKAEEAADAERAELWKLVPGIALPTLVVRGGESDIFSDEGARKLVDALPDAEFIVIPGAGHTVQGDQPVLLANALQKFFARRLQGAGVR